ncbi:DUF3152 domain-containing protein [Streptomyces peucetius]|uniref:DUF3152 domain-containing protein n=1 Tax=Streptomyces peucetius TaxID=1950 RepID=A0ABY6IBZ8_STRPE|nr:DUF3152 domain-containing protein [Streptomyces peucetius]UYQ64254.1 DUF3152 domain-containing protein [Streptomyces peucetius]
MGRHSRKGHVPKDARTGAEGGPPPGEREAVTAVPGNGRRRRAAEPDGGPWPEQQPSGYYGAPQTRGGHPEHHEAGGGWGDWTQGGQRPQPPRPGPAPGRVPGPRREYLEAFDQTPSPRAPRTDPNSSDPFAPRTDWDTGHGRPPEIQDDSDSDALADTEGAPEDEPPAKGGKGRTFTGIAAAAVTTVLAVVVAGQVAADRSGTIGGQSSGERPADERPARSEGRPTPPQAAEPPAAAPSYRQLMARQFPIDPELTASGDFAAVPGFDKAPGKGRKIRYRVDVEKGLGMDAGLFARAVQETLNDDRSWAHGGAMTFERISSGEPEFVITLASPGTTAVWCAKSGLDTTVDNVSCDSASTERVMINAFRWAQGAETYGDDGMLAYRQMLINHEIGHRLGYNHVNCSTPGALAPVMQQQTKTLEIGGIKCRANPWVHPGE